MTNSLNQVCKEATPDFNNMYDFEKLYDDLGIWQHCHLYWVGLCFLIKHLHRPKLAAISQVSHADYEVQS